MKWNDSSNFTHEQIVIAIKTWANYPGFSAETCGQCKRKVNVLAGGPGWFCICEHYNTQVIHGSQIPHEQPDLGPTRVTINAAHTEVWEK